MKTERPKETPSGILSDIVREYSRRWTGGLQKTEKKISVFSSNPMCWESDDGDTLWGTYDDAMRLVRCGVGREDLFLVP